MILVADCGSTKCDWKLVDKENKSHLFTTIGFNPFFNTDDNITLELKKNLVSGVRKYSKGQLLTVYFYGAGCSNSKRNDIIKRGIQRAFPESNVFVDHDLLGAARALCGKEKGIACILGTGSNSCYYDGKNIVDNIPALGFILGDEASGAYFGKKLVHHFLYREIPKNLEKKFIDKFNVDKEKIFNGVYFQSSPNRFLASFAPFIFENLRHPFIDKMIISGLESFFDRQICKYDKHKKTKINFVGSMAFLLQDKIIAIAKKRNLQIGIFVRSPIDNLVKYHLS